MKTLPLIENFRADAAFARTAGRVVTQGEYVAQVQRLAAQLPSQPYAINLCEDRYRFMLVLAAVSLRSQSCLLPSSATPAAIDALHAAYPDTYRIGDAEVDITPCDASDAVPVLPAEHIAAVLFTSGSTGTPQPYPKTWRALRVIALHLGERLLTPGVRTQIVATVPPQHMYGLETTVTMALGADCVVHGGRPFFPQDVVQALQQMPAPRVLVTAPVHLRALIDAGTELPPLDFILSATAPLSADLAAACEARWRAPVLEIYGCTEAGSMATRRTTAGERWQLLRDMELRIDDGAVAMHADHLPSAMPLQDLIELESGGYFRLLGRSADLLKVAGRRASLSELTQKLAAIPGVHDAVIFNAGAGESARLAALVVAPQLSEAAILDALAQQIDAVFLPRPLRRVERLPRNELGKLQRATLLQLIGRPA